MARPIRNTPILMGKDAEWFEKEISNLPPLEVRRANRARIEEGARRFIAAIQALKK